MGGPRYEAKYAIAICGAGALGLILHEKKQKVTYPNGSTGEAYVGIHLTNEIAPIGSPWSSRKPLIIGHMTAIPEFVRALQAKENGE